MPTHNFPSTLCRSFMQSSGGDVAAAVSVYYDMMGDGGMPAPAPAPAAGAAARSGGAPSNSSSSSSRGAPCGSSSSSSGDRAAAGMSDEEYAAQLAAEMYGDDNGRGSGSDHPMGRSSSTNGNAAPFSPEVRAPEEQKIERLIDFPGAGRAGGGGRGGMHGLLPGMAYGVGGNLLGPVQGAYVPSAFRGLKDVARGNTAAAAVSAAAASAAGGKRKGASGGGGGGGKGAGLASLLGPPTDLLFEGTYDDARTFAKAHGRWLMVNLQVRPGCFFN